MSSSEIKDINEILLEAHELSVLRAEDVAVRTGTPLIVSKNGKIVAVKPRYKYVRVPIRRLKKKS